MPHSAEVMMKPILASMNSRTSPKRLARKPVIGIEMAFATPNEVITQVPWLVDAPRLPAMVGIATLAIVLSSTCMKVARDRAMVISQRVLPSSGGCGVM